MRAVEVKDGKVVNAARFLDAETAEARGWIVTDVGRIGDNWDGATFTTPPEPTPVYTLDEARLAMVRWIDGLTTQITLRYPDSVQKRWLIEEAAARAVDADSATLEQVAMITREGAAKGRSPQEHATAIIANADKFRAIADQTNTLFLSTIKALEDEPDPAKFHAIMTAAIASAAPLAKEYGLEVV